MSHLTVYRYNQGNNVDTLGKINLGEFGDHVGDWYVSSRYV
jgi:hypothetical protein